MKMKLLKTLAVSSLVSLGTIALAGGVTSCGGGAPVSFTLNGESIQNNSANIYAEGIYTLTATYEGEPVDGFNWTWSNSAVTSFTTWDLDGASVDFAVGAAGEYTVTASLMVGERTITTATVTLNATEGAATYEVIVDTTSSKTAYQQLDVLDVDANIIAFRNRYVGGVYAGRTLLNSELMTLTATVNGATINLVNGYEFETVGTYSVIATSSGISSEPFEITVTGNDAYGLVRTLRELASSNYSVYGVDYYYGNPTTEKLVDEEMGVVVDLLGSSAYMEGSLSYEDGSTQSGVIRFFEDTTEDGGLTYNLDNFVVTTSDYQTGFAFETVQTIGEFMNLNGEILASEYDDTLISGSEIIYEELEDGTDAYVVAGDLVEYFLRLGGLTSWIMDADLSSMVGYVYDSGTPDEGFQVIIASPDSTGEAEILAVIDVSNIGMTDVSEFTDIVSEGTYGYTSEDDTGIADVIRVYSSGDFTASYGFSASVNSSGTGYDVSYYQITFNPDYAIWEEMSGEYILTGEETSLTYADLMAACDTSDYMIGLGRVPDESETTPPGWYQVDRSASDTYSLNGSALSDEIAGIFHPGITGFYGFTSSELNEASGYGAVSDGYLWSRSSVMNYYTEEGSTAGYIEYTYRLYSEHLASNFMNMTWLEFNSSVEITGLQVTVLYVTSDYTTQADLKLESVTTSVIGTTTGDDCYYPLMDVNIEQFYGENESMRAYLDSFKPATTPDEGVGEGGGTDAGIGDTGSAA